MKITEDELWKAAITSREVLEKKSPIVSVFYDEDGDWQFFGEEDVDEDDAQVLSLEEILAHDPTLSTLPDMKPGQGAVRADCDSEWKLE